MRHAALVVAGFSLLFTWLYARPIVTGTLLAEADMYEEFLPQFLAPITVWSGYEFGGWPAFADFQDTPFYPPQLVGRLLGSWTFVIVSAYVLAASFTYAYVYTLTRSRLAATFAGVCFGLSEAMMERLPHVTVLQTTAWLPLLVLVLERLRGPSGAAWVAIGAAAIGSAILGGHPPMLLYSAYACGLYALTGWLVERGGWGYIGRLAAAAALGVGLAAVKVLPLIEAISLTARQQIPYSGFVSNANTPVQMLSALMPPIVHPGGEGATYVGLAALTMGLTAAMRPLRNWRIAFWLAITVVSVLIAMADATPVARIAYELPFYDRFRIVGRHLILAAFGAATLAGFGVEALERGSVSRRAVYVALGLVAVGLSAVVVATGRFPDAFEIDTDHGLPWNLPFWHGAIWRQLAIAGATLVVVGGAASRLRSRPWRIALIVVLASDLILALPYDLRPTGLDVRTIPPRATGPSVHAARLAAGLTPQHQRLLAPAGTTTDDVLPASFARVWQIPIAGGYNPMLLASYSDLAMMGTNGSVDPLVLADDNAALDVLAVKYVVLKPHDFASSGTVVRDGITRPVWPMDVPVGARECGQRHPRTASFGLPRDVDVGAVLLWARLQCSDGVRQGTEVARLRLVDRGGTTYEQPVRAGIDIADAGLGDRRIRQRAGHDLPPTVSPGFASPTFSVRMNLPAPIRSARLDLQLVDLPGWLEIAGVTVLDGSGRSVPVEMTTFLLTPARWREVDKFATSRVTDRGSDEEGPGEQPYVVFENRRARPRAWLAEEVIPLAEKDMRLAVHHSRLPDGRPFDSSRHALVEPGARPAARYPGGTGTVTVRTVRDGSIVVDLITQGGGFLVLSETFYPGWRARIGREVLPIHRTNASLQGVAVPAGYQRVEFEFVSTTLYAGAALSVLAAIALALVARRGFRRGSD